MFENVLLIKTLIKMMFSRIEIDGFNCHCESLNGDLIELLWLLVVELVPLLAVVCVKDVEGLELQSFISKDWMDP